ncbi:unnamed protein product [Gongylonema pulchrum]|uniref:F-box domain-containing protein n=1 Tax=Gongylonema pulchrum TaxID=637853 RepID=A0A183EGT6_9BILA|nr:unnamed protein product [Gongylonema pulchrum]
MQEANNDSSKTASCSSSVSAGDMAHQAAASDDGQSPQNLPVDDLPKFSDEEELRQFRAMAVCGKLRGRLPDGFLSQFRDLPNELIVKIW